MTGLSLGNISGNPASNDKNSAYFSRPLHLINPSLSNSGEKLASLLLIETLLLLWRASYFCLKYSLCNDLIVSLHLPSLLDLAVQHLALLHWIYYSEWIAWPNQSLLTVFSILRICWNLISITDVVQLDASLKPYMFWQYSWTPSCSPHMKANRL